MSDPEIHAGDEQGILIRPGTMADIGALALLMERAYALRDNKQLPLTADKASIEEIETDISTPSAWSYIAVNGTRVAGFALGFPSSEADNVRTDPETDYLSLLMVEPDFWHRSIGTRLLDIVESRAKQAGKQHIVLWTRQANNSRTQNIYERRRYKRNGQTTTDGPYGPQYQYQLDL